MTITMFRDMLARVLSAPERYASKSYMHPANGFYKVELGEILGGKLRLHIWPGGWSGPGHIHDHRWDFVSHVLQGTLIERRFYEKPDERLGWTELTHAHPHDVERLDLFSGGISLTSESFHEKGDTYSCPAGAIHQLFPKDFGKAATLVFTGSPNGKNARVFDVKLFDESVGKNWPPHFETKSLDPLMLAGLVRELLS